MKTSKIDLLIKHIEKSVDNVKKSKTASELYFNADDILNFSMELVEEAKKLAKIEKSIKK